MNQMVNAILSGGDQQELLHCPLPESFRAAHLLANEVHMFGHEADKDVRRSIHVGEIPFPTLEPDDVVVAVMASSINFNTVWSATFEPVPTFRFLSQWGRVSQAGARHNQQFHIIGSDASGIVVKKGAAVRRWSVGDRVVIHTAYVDEQDPRAQDDGMLTSDLRAWGYETNFGGLADFTVVKATQLLPKARHLSWEEAACMPLCAGTAYRMLVSTRGAQMKQGDMVLIWGATGGLGAFAVQLVKNGGGIPIGVVSSPEKAVIAKSLGCASVIDRNEMQLGLKQGQLNHKAWITLREQIRRELGEDPHIVFDYVGAQTFGASVYLARRGGSVVTCGSSTGYIHEFDNRYLWMNLKRIIGCHGANYHEAWEANRLVHRGMLHPTLSRTFPLSQVGEATRWVQLNQHVGKVAVLCLAAEEGSGIDDYRTRERIGEAALNAFRTVAKEKM